MRYDLPERTLVGGVGIPTAAEEGGIAAHIQAVDTSLVAAAVPAAALFVGIVVEEVARIVADVVPVVLVECVVCLPPVVLHGLADSEVVESISPSRYLPDILEELALYVVGPN